MDINTNNIEIEEKEYYKVIKQEGNFDIEPCETLFDFDDKQRFRKLAVTDSQKKQLYAMMNQMPNVFATGAIAQAYCVKFPEGLSHTLTALKQGGYGSMIKGTDGKFIGSASFYSMTPQAVAMGAFTAMSIASGQYFLAQINKELNMISMKMDKILEFLYGDKKAELISELTFIKYTYENFISIMAHEEQRTATIASIQAAKKVAMKDIEFYISELNTAVAENKKQSLEIVKMGDEIFKIKNCLELSMQLYIMSNLLELYYAQNYDKSYIEFLEETVTAYISKCEQHILSCFSILKNRFSELKGNVIKKIDIDDYKKQITGEIEKLNTGEETMMKKGFRKALYEFTKQSEFYLRSDGNIYIKCE